METVFALIVILTMILLPVFLIVWLIRAIRKRPTQKIKVTCFATFIIFAICTAGAISLTCNHEWVDATCSAPKTCTLCGETEGESLQHQWEEATCVSARKCSLCDLTEGAALEHTYTDWEIDVEATVSVPGKRVRYCTSCQSVDSESYQLKSYIQKNKFIFTPKELRDRFFDAFVELGYSKFGGAQVREKEGQVMVSIIDIGYNNVGNIGFVTDKNTMQMATSETEDSFDGIVMIISASEEFVANAIIAVIMSTNPTITEYGAREVAKSVLTEATSWAGITYTFALTGNYYTMTAIPSEK